MKHVSDKITIQGVVCFCMKHMLNPSVRSSDLRQPEIKSLHCTLVEWNAGLFWRLSRFYVICYFRTTGISSSPQWQNFPLSVDYLLISFVRLLVIRSTVKTLGGQLFQKTSSKNVYFVSDLQATTCHESTNKTNVPSDYDALNNYAPCFIDRLIRTLYRFTLGAF